MRVIRQESQRLRGSVRLMSGVLPKSQFPPQSPAIYTTTRPTAPVSSSP
jgi:hypothetical protein